MEEHHVVALTVIRTLSRWGLLDRVDVKYNPTLGQYQTWLLDDRLTGNTHVLMCGLETLSVLEKNVQAYENGDGSGGVDVIVDNTIAELCAGGTFREPRKPEFTDVETRTGLFALEVLRWLPGFNQVVFINHRVHRWDSQKVCLTHCDPAFVVTVDAGGVFTDSALRLVPVTSGNKNLLVEVCRKPIPVSEVDRVVVQSWWFAVKVNPKAEVKTEFRGLFRG